jgi:hypothetical protein
VLKSRGVYMVCTDEGKAILSCPTSVTNNNLNGCDIFAFRPDNGAAWHPYNLLADDTIEVLYVSDMSYSTVHALAYDGS